jgi:hypothetical protein
MLEIFSKIFLLTAGNLPTMVRRYQSFVASFGVSIDIHPSPPRVPSRSTWDDANGQYLVTYRYLRALRVHLSLLF